MPDKTATERLVLRITRTLPFPRQRVFDAWTKPEQLKQWFAPGKDMTTPIAEVDLKVGGAYKFGMGEPDPVIVCGHYLELVPPEKIVFTWNWPKGTMDDLGETRVTVALKDVDGGTELTLVHEGFRNTQERDMHDGGWSGCLKKLAAKLGG